MIKIIRSIFRYIKNPIKGSFNNYVDRILAFFLPQIMGGHTVGQDRQKCKVTSNLDRIVMHIDTSGLADKHQKT